MFWMAIVDFVTSSFVLSTVIVWGKKIKIVEEVCASPAEYLKELTPVFKKSWKFRQLTREYIWKIRKSSKIHYYIMCSMMLTSFVNVHVHVNTGAKGNLVMVERYKYPPIRESTSERLPKLIEGSKYVYCTCLKLSLNRPDVFKDCNHRIKKKNIRCSLLGPAWKSAQRCICLNYLPWSMLLESR